MSSEEMRKHQHAIRKHIAVCDDLITDLQSHANDALKLIIEYCRMYGGATTFLDVMDQCGGCICLYDRRMCELVRKVAGDGRLTAEETCELHKELIANTIRMRMAIQTFNEMREREKRYEEE